MNNRLDLSYERHFASVRPDGRYQVVMAAEMAKARERKAQLALPDGLDATGFEAWQQAVKARLTRQLNLPRPVPQPAPVRLSSTEREGYTAEKWELYPDPFTAVPFLALIPDGADANNPVPGVICMPDSQQTKEFIAGEPELDHPNCRTGRRPDTDRMGLYLVQKGMAAFVFDNPGDGECSVLSDPAAGATQEYVREILCHGLLEMGLSFAGVSAFQKLRFLEQLDSFPMVDPKRIGICAQGLGTDAAIAVGLLSDRVKCIAFHDILRDERYCFGATTEHHQVKMEHELEKWQVVPGKMRAYSYADLCAAFAPRPLALTEGGADPLVATVRRAYAVCGAEENLQVSYYPAYADPSKRTLNKLPEVGMSREEFARYSYVDGVERTFRKEPVLALFRRCFGI
ncbi:MAG: acetylxylan esterase [Oscillospiraceae bacterium]|nr:acetylxylan esterase [Oscillospiraceae bacterium]